MSRLSIVSSVSMQSAPNCTRGAQRNQPRKGDSLTNIRFCESIHPKFRCHGFIVPLVSLNVPPFPKLLFLYSGENVRILEAQHKLDQSEFPSLLKIQHSSENY